MGPSAMQVESLKLETSQSHYTVVTVGLTHGSSNKKNYIKYLHNTRIST